MASLEVRPGSFVRAVSQLRQRGALLRIGIGLLGVLLTWAVLTPWTPPFPYRTGYTPGRDLLAAVTFKRDDETKTRIRQDRAAATTHFVFANNPEALERLPGELGTVLVQVTSAETMPRGWQDFLPATKPTTEQQRQSFQQFKTALSAPGAVDRLLQAVNKTLALYKSRGILDLDELPDENEPGLRDEIAVYVTGSSSDPEFRQIVPVAEVQIGSELYRQLADRLSAEAESILVADHIFNWIVPRLPPRGTLSYDERQTRQEREIARSRVSPAKTTYAVGQMLATHGTPLTATELELLRLEHAEAVSQMSLLERATRAGAMLGLIVALYALCGYYMFRYDGRMVSDLKNFGLLIAMAVLAVAMASWLAVDQWRAEMIPLLVFAMTVSVAFRQELALIFTSALALLVVCSLGHGLVDLVVAIGSVATAVLMLARIRSRSKLIKVGFCAGAVALILTPLVGILDGQPWEQLLREGLRTGAWALVAGFLVSGSLPFIENQFGVVNDISLLELGDVSHPLLQELVRRAPGTYNHSINVASIGDAAAEAIGANGLLVRVGAYFHDIGKMLKPNYFVENQGQEANRHDSLVPEMSTLIIIAHVKDGADLARQHHLPQPLIDFIEQHHGTTLVQYFYNLASRQREGNPDASDVQESAFRYPGPKPQSKEAGVLMLSDAVESASRTLQEPTPTRIRNLVGKIVMDRLLDGQFDQCGLTLMELKAIEDSLIKSLIAVYHGRVKYPEHTPESNRPETKPVVDRAAG